MRDREFVIRVNEMDIHEGDVIQFESIDGMRNPTFKIEEHTIEYKKGFAYVGYYLPWEAYGTLYSVNKSTIKVIRNIHDRT